REARAAQMIKGDGATIIAQAKALIDWHRRHGFCRRCGTPIRIMYAGYRRPGERCLIRIAIGYKNEKGAQRWETLGPDARWDRRRWWKLTDSSINNHPTHGHLNGRFTYFGEK